MSLNKISLVLFIISLNTIKCNAEKETASPVVELNQGKLKGFKETSTDGKTFYSFLGIPFAQSPVGNLRFEVPMKAEKWTGVLEANKMPEMCIQMDMFSLVEGKHISAGVEDCLYLNVYTPKILQPTDTVSSLPVMVFIHGGGYVGGAASFAPPHVLLNEEIVLVVIQYRVGVFGFLSTEDSSMPGNMGLKDQTMALKWVQENIRSFGGNPDKVTIFGESAGGGSVHLHVLSPHSKGLFTGAIAQSGSALCPWSVGLQHRNYAKEFGQEVGCSLKEDGKDFKHCLKGLDASLLVLAMGPFYKWGFTPLVTVPRVDGDFLPDAPATLLRTGRYNKVNFICGINRDEGIMDTVFALLNPKLKNDLTEEFETFAPYTLRIENEPDAANLSKVIYHYYLKGKKLDDNPMDEMSEMFSDCAFKISVDLTSHLHAQDPDITFYSYEFNHRGQRSIMDLFDADGVIPKSYVSHADELYYLFTGGPFFPLPLEREEDLELRRKMTKLWTNFAKFGNPTPEGSFEFTWNPTTAANFQHLSITTQPTMKDYPRREVLEFWMSLDMHANRLISLKDGKVIQKKKDEL